MAEVNEVLTLTQIKKLKVAELRDRLQKLDKPTGGLKPDLVNRLFEALFEAQKKEAMKSNVTGEVIESVPVVENEGLEKKSESEEKEPVVEMEESVEIKEKEPEVNVVEMKESVEIKEKEREVTVVGMKKSVEIKEKEPEVTVVEMKESVEIKGKEPEVTVVKMKVAEEIKEKKQKEIVEMKKCEKIEKEQKESVVEMKEAEEPEEEEHKENVVEVKESEVIKENEQKETVAEMKEAEDIKKKKQKEIVEMKKCEKIEEKEQKENVVEMKEAEEIKQNEQREIVVEAEAEEIKEKEQKETIVEMKEAEELKKNERKEAVVEMKEAEEIKEKETVQKPPKERKRRWGSTSLSSSNVYTKGISSDAIKELIPDLNKSIAKVSSKTDDTINSKNTSNNNNKLNNSTNQTGIGQSNSEVTANHGTNGVIESKRPDEKRLLKSNSVNEDIGKPKAPTAEQMEGSDTRRRSSAKDIKADELMVSVNKVPSPAHNEPTNIIFIRNLVRPFTLMQLKEILSKNGKINEKQFWIDKIKSKCYVAYESQEQALATRESLHGLRWPEANPKTLIVDFATHEELDYHLNLEKGIVPPAPTQETPKHEIKRQTEAPKTTSKDKYDIVIRREKPEEKDKLTKLDDRKEVRKDENKREDVKVDKRPIREWDREKFIRKSDGDNASPVKRRRSSSHSPRRGEGDIKIREKDKPRDLKNDQKQKEISQESESPANLLDGLFKKTKATPCIYWLPLNDEQSKKRAEERIETERRRNEERIARDAERRKRIEEMNRARRPSPPIRREAISPRRGRGSYGSRRPLPPRFRGRRVRSGSESESSSRSRSRSRTRGRSPRSVSRSRSRSRSPPRKGSPPRRGRSRSRTPPRRSPRRR